MITPPPSRSRSRSNPLLNTHYTQLPYLHFVVKLAALGRPVIAIEYPHLAMRWIKDIPNVEQVR